jgi:hypothetical protein
VDLSTAFPQLIDRDMWKDYFEIFFEKCSRKNPLHNGDFRHFLNRQMIPSSPPWASPSSCSSGCIVKFGYLVSISGRRSDHFRSFLSLDLSGDSAIMKMGICKKMEVECMAQRAIREYDSQLPLLAGR